MYRIDNFEGLLPYVADKVGDPVGYSEVIIPAFGGEGNGCDALEVINVNKIINGEPTIVIPEDDELWYKTESDTVFPFNASYAKSDGNDVTIISNELSENGWFVVKFSDAVTTFKFGIIQDNSELNTLYFSNAVREDSDTEAFSYSPRIDKVYCNGNEFPVHSGGDCHVILGNNVEKYFNFRML